MRSRRGFSLVEVVIATLVFSIGALGMVASAAAISKQLLANRNRSNAALTARTRAETAFAAGCGGASGVATLDQQIERRDGFGLHSDRFLSAVPCE